MISWWRSRTSNSNSIFQPQATTEGAVVAFEVSAALAASRARHHLADGVHSAVAEESGLIGAIDEWVVREAWSRGGDLGQSAVDRHQPVASQLSAWHDVPGMLAAVLAETGLCPKRVEIEITEGVLD